MSSRKGRYAQEMYVDMYGLFCALIRRLWLCVLTAVLCAAISVLCAVYFIEPKYQSNVLFYVNNASISAEGIQQGISFDDIRVSKHMVDTYEVILYSRKTLADAIEWADIDVEASIFQDSLRVSELIGMQRVNSTEIFSVTVIWTDPKETERIADAVAHVLPKRIDEIVDDTSARVVDYAILPMQPVSPDKKYYLMMGGILGFVMSAGVIALRNLYDIRIKSVQTLIQYDHIPVLATIPDLIIRKKRASSEEAAAHEESNEA